MTLADLLNTLESADMLRIIKGRRGNIRRVSCIICTGGRSHELQTL